MSIQIICKKIESINIESNKKELIEEIKQLKVFATFELDKISKANKKQYTKDIELSRKRKTINNSKQAIKKAWKNRHNKKELILKHILILRNLS